MPSDNQTNKSNRKVKSVNKGAVLSDISKLNQILTSCSGSLYVVQNNRIVFHNPQFTGLTGYSSNEIEKMNFTDLVHPKDKKLINLLFSNNFREISQKSSRSYTFRALHKTGEMIWLKSNVSLIDWNGEPALLDNCFDITQQKEFEQKLVEEEQNFRLLVNGFEDMVFIIGKRGSVVQGNRSVYNRLGYNEHEVILKAFSGFFPSSQREEVRKLVAEAFFGKRVNFSSELIKSNGKSIPVEARFFLGSWSQKEVVFAVCQDISQRIEAERIVRVSEEKFSKAFETNAVMMTISTFEGGKFIDVNDTFLNTTGFKRDQVIGHTSYELGIFPEIGLREQLKQLIRREGKASDIETTMINSKGKRLLCNFSAELIEIQGELCLLVVMTDITEKRLAEEKIMLSEQRFRQLAELLPEKVFEADNLGMITFMNHYLLSFFGYESSKFSEGIHITSLFSRKSQSIIRDYLRKSKSSPELPSVELMAQRSDGTQFPALTHITAIFENGKVNRYMGVMVDISVRKEQEMELIKAKEQAEEASKAKEQFLSTMSHEIRTPMNAVIGMANILLQENPMPHQMENLTTLKFSAEGLMGLLNDILDFNKIEAGKLIINRYPLNLKTLIEGIWNVHKHIAKKKGITLELNFDPEIPHNLLGDTLRINQIITNLTSNAIKFTEYGKVIIKVKLEKETKQTASVFFSVCDTGIGIPTEKQKLVFQEFTQANYQTARKYGGTGLGLAISRQLVSLMKGEIELRSQPNKGSEFFFTLTFRKSRQEATQMDEQHALLPKLIKKKGQPLKILVVEDNEINSFIAIKFLKSWGVSTELAENGEIALEMINSQEFDLILMDLEMPVMNGYEAANQIRKLNDPIKRKIPIIALTASAMLDVQKKIFNLGMNGFVLKPFNPSDLQRKIADLLKLS